MELRLRVATREEREKLLPPLDVAFIWHAHLIRPNVYAQAVYNLEATMREWNVEPAGGPCDDYHDNWKMCPLPVGAVNEHTVYAYSLRVVCGFCRCACLPSPQVPPLPPPLPQCAPVLSLSLALTNSSPLELPPFQPQAPMEQTLPQRAMGLSPYRCRVRGCTWRAERRGELSLGGAA
jgi:hypothetical protein